jgi:GTP-binding protein EngB required for normal cell division
VEHPGWGFAQVGKLISDEWKAVGKEEIEALKEEAEQMNATNVKKLPKFTDSGNWQFRKTYHVPMT